MNVDCDFDCQRPTAMADVGLYAQPHPYNRDYRCYKRIHNQALLQGVKQSYRINFAQHAQKEISMNGASNAVAKLMGQGEKSMNQGVSNPAKDVEDWAGTSETDDCRYDCRYMARQEQGGRLWVDSYRFRFRSTNSDTTPQMRPTSQKSLRIATSSSKLPERPFVGVTYISITEQ